MVLAWEQSQITHGAPQPQMMPNGCLGSSVLVLPRLDRGSLMDVATEVALYGAGIIPHVIIAIFYRTRDGIQFAR
jgi:hypothetical protein